MRGVWPEGRTKTRPPGALRARHNAAGEVGGGPDHGAGGIGGEDRATDVVGPTNYCHRKICFQHLLRCKTPISPDTGPQVASFALPVIQRNNSNDAYISMWGNACSTNRLSS